MTSTTSSTVPTSGLTRAHASLLPYLLWLLVSGAVLHTAITLTGNRIGWTAAIGTGIIGLAYAAYAIRMGHGLSRVRYGRLVAHALTYVAVVGGYLLHAYVLLALGSPAIVGDGGRALDAGWMGAALAMGGLWAPGLLIHGFGAIMDRGFEGTRA